MQYILFNTSYTIDQYKELPRKHKTLLQAMAIDEMEKQAKAAKKEASLIGKMRKR